MPECPGSGKLPIPGTYDLGFDFDEHGDCPVCKLRCGLMLDSDIGKAVVKPHSADEED